MHRGRKVVPIVADETSFTELRRDGLACEKWNRDHPGESRKSWVEQCLGGCSAAVVAVSDYLCAVPDLVRAWVPAPCATHGTDGFGTSDTRANLRRHFGIDRASIVAAVLAVLK